MSRLYFNFLCSFTSRLLRLNAFCTILKLLLEHITISGDTLKTGCCYSAIVNQCFTICKMLHIFVVLCIDILHRIQCYPRNILHFLTSLWQGNKAEKQVIYILILLNFQDNYTQTTCKQNIEYIHVFDIGNCGRNQSAYLLDYPYSLSDVRYCGLSIF